ncbi:MAG: HAMP domain-containing protein, partial [Leptolyngbya sp. SIO3F4]|nr:HAMP domain-containing protein [Leptolyngbya sp. SIO3F4]
MNTHLSHSSIQNPSKQSKGWLSGFQVIQKIGLGYALVTGVVFTGTINGIIIAQRYANEAYQRNEDIIEEILAVTALSSLVNQFVAQERELITWFGRSDEFQESYEAYRTTANEFKTEWAEFLTEYDEDIDEGIEETDEELELLEDLVSNYSDVVDANLRNVTEFVEKYAPSDVQGQQLIEAQRSFVTLNQSPEALELENFSQDLTAFVEFIKDDELGDAQELVEQSAQLQLQIVVISIVLSIIIAALLAYFISRTISKPLRALEKTALRVTQEENFDLRATTSNNDEVGSLAKSLNQLIEWVGTYTHALKLSQQDLESQTQELDAIIDNLGDGLLVVSPHGTITRANPILKRMLELGETLLRGQPVQSVSNQQIIELISQHQANPEKTLSTEVLLSNNRIGQALVTMIAPSEISTTPSPP